MKTYNVQNMMKATSDLSDRISEQLENRAMRMFRSNFGSDDRDFDSDDRNLSSDDRNLDFDDRNLCSEDRDLRSGRRSGRRSGINFSLLMVYALGFLLIALQLRNLLLG